MRLSPSDISDLPSDNTDVLCLHLWSCNDGAKVDVWAAGVTLYQMVVGHIPFDADNLCDLYATISRANVDLPSTVVVGTLAVVAATSFAVPLTAFQFCCHDVLGRGTG